MLVAACSKPEISTGNGHAHEGGVEAMAPQLSVVVRGKKISCPGVDLLLGAVPSIRTTGAEIRLPDERHVEALQAVVGYLAGGCVRMEGVDVLNAAEVLECAKLLGLSGAKDACEESLVRCVSAETCVKLRQLAAQRALPRLARECDHFLSESFPSVLTGQPAQRLPRIQVHLDVSSQLLEVGTDLLEKVVPKTLATLHSLRGVREHLEETVVQLILLPDFRVSEWSKKACAKILQAPFSPEKHTPDFFAKLRNGCSPARQLILGSKEEEKEEKQLLQGMRLIAMVKLSDASAVCLVEEQNSLVLVTVSLCTFLQNGHLPASPTTGLPTLSQTNGCFISHMSLSRSGFGVVTTESEIMAVGGFNRDGCLDSNEQYSSITNSWKEVGQMKTRRGRLAAVRVGSKVYAIGGSDGRRELSSVEVLDMKSCEWQKMKTGMPTPRSCLGAAELDGKVYVVGGEHYSIPLKTVETYDPATTTWQSLPPMRLPRTDLTVVACAGKLYAIGGKARGLQCLSTVECYDPTKSSWSPKSSMKCARRNATAVAVGDKVMVIGGYSGSTALQSVEIYDPQADEWTNCPPMCTARSHASAALYNNMVYVFGGFSGRLFLNTVEYFDLKSEQWTPFV